MGTLVLDLKFALRQLRKSPGFTVTAVLMLAFGIGATSSIFSIVNGVLLRPLPFPEPDRLVVLADKLQGFHVNNGNSEVGVTAPDIRAYTRDTHSFESMGGYQFASYELSGTGEPAFLTAARMTAGVFPALRVAPLMGRFFTVQEDEQNQQVVMLSYSAWQERFHGDPHILGTKVLLDRKPYVVIGVMPRNFEFPLQAGQLNRVQLWVPMSFQQDELTRGAASWSYQTVGRLRRGVTAAQAQSDAERVAQDIMRSYPAFMASLRISSSVRPLHEETIEDAKPLVRTLFLAVAVVLLIACANLAGLLLVRAIRRQREMAVRQALGAPASALVRQTLMESLLLSVSGGMLGVVLAGVALQLGKGMLPESLPRIDEIGLNWEVVVFALGLAILTGVLCGLAPAFAALRTNVNETLKEGGRSGSAGGVHARLRSALVVAEIAVALVLLTASGLLLRSFEKMRAVNLGYDPEHVTTASYSLPQKQYSTQAQVDTFDKELLRRMRQIPGAKYAALVSMLPASNHNNNQAFIPEGYVPQGNNLNLATSAVVVGDYFESMGIPLVRGRFFTEADQVTTQLVIIVNRKLADHYWPNQSPIGKRLHIGTQEMQMPWLTVVGEVDDVKLSSPDEETKAQFYFPVTQMEADIGSLASPNDLNGNGGYLVLRSMLPPEHMENALRQTVQSIDPQLPLTEVQTMVQAVSESEAPRRFNTAVITSFAFAAVALAVLGIYSVIAFSVASRVSEMAIRMALGSQRSGIIQLVLISAGKLAAIGCVIGLLGAAGASGLLRSFLFDVSPFDPMVMILAALCVLALALAASALPAMRAAAIDPMKALRSE